MSTEGTIAALVMLIVGVAWLALPILRRKYSASAEELARVKERDILVTTYERMLASLRDVDEDHLTGKLAQADYESERAYWTDQAVVVLQALEKAGGKAPTKARKAAEPIPVDADAQLDDAIEKTIANYIKSTH